MRDLATTPAVTCRRATTVEQVARQLREAGTGCVVVIDDDDRPVGICTDRDIVVRCVADGWPLQTPIEALMSTGVITVRGDADAQRAEDLLGTWGFRRLPVVNDDGQVMGVVSLDDLAIQLSTDVARLADVLRAARR